MIKLQIKIAISILLLTAVSSTLQAKEEKTEPTTRWEEIRGAIFKGAEVEQNSSYIQLDAPGRAFDAAIVPVKVNITLPEGETIDQLYILVDDNPAPLAATFTFRKQNSNFEVQTRVRVHEVTDIRTVTKTSKGRYFMDASYIKASGGCSAPALPDQVAAMERIGKLKFKMGEPSEVLPQSKVGHILLSHPNNSGMQFDQISRNFIPAHYVNRMSVMQDDEELFVVDSNFSLSENPSIHFTFDIEDGKDSTISIKAIDTKNKNYEKTWQVEG